MAVLNDLLAQVGDEALRARIEREVARLTKHKKFGLVFEEHLPESTRLHDIPIKPGLRVQRLSGKDKAVYQVLKIADGVATCLARGAESVTEIPLNEIVAVAEFGEAVYPGLKLLGSVKNAPDSDLWHTLIEADNFHALQLLEYVCPGQVDCIYIDPPYNTGAKDWKYNNDYVDASDSYRHSKWLSMMQKRLKLAKRLLNPKDSVLIVTIDEKEYLHLGCLLEEMFPEARMQMVSTVINPAGVTRVDQFSRTDEYVYFVLFGSAAPIALKLDEDWRGKVKGGYKDKLRWNGLQRSGTSVLREDRPNMFYPIFIDKSSKKIVGIGNSIPLHQDRKEVVAPEGAIIIWPIFPDGREGRWRVGQDTLKSLIAKHFVKLGKIDGERASVTYLAQGEQTKVETGEFPIIGYNEDGSIIVDESQYEARFVPGTQWWIASHDATQKGTKVLNAIIGEPRFSFPKSLYAVHDCIRFFVANKPNALVLDFFAGSGTTLHAVNLLNAEDGGHRRCIMVTNNEVSAEEAKALSAKGLKPGDEEWDSLGIARYVTWPRTVCSIEGHDVNGAPLKGKYLGSEREMADGFAANAVFFKLAFLDRMRIAYGMQLKELLPVLWMKAGGAGECPNELPARAPFAVYAANRFAILVKESAFEDFRKALECEPAVDCVYLVTDFEAGFAAMSERLKPRRTVQLHRDYLDNFRINAERMGR